MNEFHKVNLPRQPQKLAHVCACVLVCLFTQSRTEDAIIADAIRIRNGIGNSIICSASSQRADARARTSRARFRPGTRAE